MAPELAPFMADECLLSMPEVEGIDYTMKEYMKLVEKTKECVDRLNAQGGDWNPHKVEMAVWSYYVLREHKPQVLEDLPGADTKTGPRVVTETSNGDTEQTNGVTEDNVNGTGESSENSTESNGNAPEDTAEPAPPQETAAAPVENGNGLGSDHSSSEVSQPANESSELTSNDPEPANQSAEETCKRPLDAETEAPSSKRVCTEAPAAEEGQAQELSKEVAKEFTTEVSSKTESEAPNGVNNTPHQITSGGD